MTLVAAAVLLGDPHFTTLDGFRYTFNGLGEYCLLATLDETTEIQVRTQLLYSCKGHTRVQSFPLHSTRGQCVTWANAPVVQNTDLK